MNEVFTFGSLFSGIGGMDLGLERAGMHCSWQVEIDPYCLRVLAKHWPDVKKYKDVRNVGSRNLRPVTLIAGGFPCQPHGLAGKRKGAEDDRNLWPEFMRIVRETKPRYVLGENVPGIITSYLDTVLTDLEGAGYTCETFNLPAIAFNAPHRRERIFVVAYSDSIRRPGSNSDNPSEGRKHNQALKQGGGNLESEPESNSKDIPNTTGAGLEGKISEGEQRRKQGLSTKRGQWVVEPGVGRVADGVPNRVDRLRGLGNAVVPQVAEWIGRRIIEYNDLPA